MRYVLITVLAFLAINSFGQNFEKRFAMVTPDVLQDPKIQWVDADNDGLLDVVITNRSPVGINVIFLKNLGNDSLKLMKTISSGYETGRILFADFNNDNKVDMVLSGNKTSGAEATEVFLNAGGFDFQQRQDLIPAKAFREILLTDLNNDGLKDFVGADANLLQVYEQTKGQFILRRDTSIVAVSLKSFDFDGNLYNDIAFSGSDASGNFTTAVLLFVNNFKISNKIQLADISGYLEAGDLDHDGFFDLAVSGKNSSGISGTTTFLNGDTTFAPAKKYLGIDSVSARIADFTSDGRADIAFLGKKNNAWGSWIKPFIGDSISLPPNAKVQDYGDYDLDGDLDIVQLRMDSIVVLNNAINVVNKGPAVVINPLGVQIYDHLFFYWEKTPDDHTPGAAVTYDLSVFDSTRAAIAPEYNHVNHERLLVSHGNLGTSNYSLEKISGDYFFEIQSIDNSFAVQMPMGGRCSRCANITTQNITACNPSSSVTLKPSAPKAMWFSFNKGFLGVHDSLNYHSAASDTVFSFNPLGSPSCSSIKLFNITTSVSDTVKITRSLRNCEGSQNLLIVDNEWQQVTWKNNLNATVSTGNALTAILQKPVVFMAFGDNTQGCHLKETFNLAISKPDLKIENSQYQIVKGSSVQLTTSGGNSYRWSPASTLSSDTICCPLATPATTTEYTVVAKDSIGCAAIGKVEVEVMEAGFIPTLFTPNGDGKNDELKIFGLSAASNFRFTVYNREGSVVFDTKDAAVAIYQGWTGLSNGQPQPPGTYYWKVEGSNNSGETLTLNGKKSGAFLLVR